MHSFRILMISLLGGMMGALLLGVTWDATFESIPLDSDPINQGDDAINDLKEEIGDRAVLEHDWGTNAAPPTARCDSVAGVCSDDGSHLEGSARVFMDTGLTAPTNRPDDSTALGTADSGRLWANNDGAAEVWDGAAWKGFGVPTNGIILWDQATGDEDCDGVASALAGDRCPCGFVEAAEFAGIFPRGAEAVANTTDVPEEVGESCSGYDGATADAGCDAADAQYDDVPTIAEMASHDHEAYMEEDGSGAAGEVVGTVTVGQREAARDAVTGGGDPHYHPFRTVLFCRKS